MNLIEFVRIMSLGFIYEFWGFGQLIYRNKYYECQLMLRKKEN
jgi:hypothetical protein